MRERGERERPETEERRERIKYRRVHREEIYYISEIDKQAKNGKKSVKESFI